MANKDKLQVALDYANLATEKDKEEKYSEAFHYYKIALDYMQYAYKYESTDQLKGKLRQRMDEFITRAESIKKYLSTQRSDNSNDNSTATSGERHKTKDGGGESDGEISDKLEGAIVTDKPNVRWSDVAGLDAAIAALEEAVILPTKFPNLFTGDRKPWKGILLYGPPGTGKTYLAKACATEANSTFLSVSSADLLSKWLGESEKTVKTLFKIARKKKPAIIFIDEVDSMCGARSDKESEASRRVKTQFLVQMQGVGDDAQGVLVLGATNVPWDLDSAIRRRFERRIYIPLPDKEGRKRMLKLGLRKNENKLTDADLDVLAQKTDGFSGADISVVVRDALFQPVRKCRVSTHFKRVIKEGKTYFTPCSPTDPDNTKTEMSLMSVTNDQLLPPPLTKQDFLDVLSTARATNSPEDLKKYVDWTNLFGFEGN